MKSLPLSTAVDTLNEKLATSPTAPITEFTNFLMPDTRQQRRKPSRKGRKRTLPPEELYADLIKAGHVQIIRRRGKPPVIKWLTK